MTMAGTMAEITVMKMIIVIDERIYLLKLPESGIVHLKQESWKYTNYLLQKELGL